MTSITPFARQLKNQLHSSTPSVELVTAEAVEAACAVAGHRCRSCFWTPTVTILTFLRQIIHANCSCRQAVAMTLAPTGPTASSREVSGDPSAYSQARQKLPRSVLEALNRRVADQVKTSAGTGRQWCGRSVMIVDGSSTTAPDMPDLQKAFPQPSAQKPGCGFPVIRLLAIFCWASGGLLEWAAASLHVGELALFRTLLDRLASGTIVLGDTYYSSYYDLVLLRQRGLDGVFRMHQRRPTDLRFGTRLGTGDHLLTWTQPKIVPRGVSKPEWEKVPDVLTVRHVQCRIDIPGFRSRELNVVTTLLDPEAYPTSELAQLYRDRWLAELNLRSLKTTLRMEALKGHSLDMVYKELMVYQMAYNLIRLLMWQAARAQGTDPRRLSFAGAQQRLAAALPYLLQCRTARQGRRILLWLLAQIASHPLPDRPNRIEPRAVKRRPKNYRRLTRPRHEARQMTYFING